VFATLQIGQSVCKNHPASRRIILPETIFSHAKYHQESNSQPINKNIKHSLSSFSVKVGKPYYIIKANIPQHLCIRTDHGITLLCYAVVSPDIKEFP